MLLIDLSMDRSVRKCLKKFRVPQVRFNRDSHCGNSGVHGKMVADKAQTIEQRRLTAIMFTPSVPTMLRQSPAGSLPLRAEVETSHGYAPYH
jgi:hypothetical protein